MILAAGCEARGEFFYPARFLKQPISEIHGNFLYLNKILHD